MPYLLTDSAGTARFRAIGRHMPCRQHD